MRHVDLNCDLGEWRNDDGHSLDRAIMPYISSCNIACGGHIGDSNSMRHTIELAIEHGVAIGAHPSYPDRTSFGRRRMELSFDELEATVMDQILTLKALTENMGAKLNHVKPHGALYHAVSEDQRVAEVVIRAIERIDPTLRVYGQSGFEFEKNIKASSLRFVAEVFADRAYEDDLRLRSRALEGAVLHDEKVVLSQLHSILIHEFVETWSGNKIPTKAETICLHSDTQGSAAFAKRINSFLNEHKVTIAAV